MPEDVIAEAESPPPVQSPFDPETTESIESAPPIEIRDGDVMESRLTAQQAPFDPAARGESWSSVPRRTKKKSLSKPELPRAPLNAEQKLLLLDTWKRSGLPARDFSALVGVSKHTLYAWKQKFEKHGPG